MKRLNTRNDKTRKKSLRTAVTICVIAAAALLIVFGYIKWRESKIVLADPLGFSISCDRSAPLDQAAEEWFLSLIAQHQQPFLKPVDRIDEYTLKAVEILENAERKIVQLDFSLKPRKLVAESFSGWHIIEEDGLLTSQWVVTFDQSPVNSDGRITYTSAKIERPAAYEIEIYNTSGQKAQEEYDREFVEEKPFDPARCPYKIENKTCYISYDAGESWIQTPLPVDQIDYYVDGHFKFNELKPGSYLIAPEKTAFLYGGFDSPLTCLYSDDRGQTWKTVPFESAPQGIHNKFISFPDAETGYIVIANDKTMSSEAESIYRSQDGGATWTRTGSGPRTSLMQSAGFVSDSIGFIAYPYVDGAQSMLYRTEDGGNTWKAAAVPMQDAYVPFFTAPEAPFLKNGELALLINEGPDSDYRGAHIMQLEYTSADNGKNWSFVQMNELPSDD